jgi:RNA polymerase sigma-70 factor (ECF subfamily)
MKDKLDDDNFLRSLLPYALSITRGKGDPWDLVIGAYEYLKKNEEKYKKHPNIKAIARRKMRNLHIDEFRKNKRFTSITDEKGQDLEIADEKQLDISDQLNLSFKTRKVLSIINTMGEKCREILWLRSLRKTYEEIAEEINIPIGTVMSRLAKCRIELKGLMA